MSLNKKNIDVWFLPSQILADTCNNLHEGGFGDPFFVPVHTYVLNPKSITMGELYGEVNSLTLEWRDGLMALTVRHACQVREKSALRLSRIKAWISNYIPSFVWDVITHPCPNFNGSLAKLPLKLGHGWVITSHTFIWMSLHIHALISALD